MVRTVLFKAFVYWAVVFLVRFLEKLVEYFFAGGTFSEIPTPCAEPLRSLMNNCETDISLVALLASLPMFRTPAHNNQS